MPSLARAWGSRHPAILFFFFLLYLKCWKGKPCNLGYSTQVFLIGMDICTSFWGRCGSSHQDLKYTHQTVLRYARDAGYSIFVKGRRKLETIWLNDLWDTIERTTVQLSEWNGSLSADCQAIFLKPFIEKYMCPKCSAGCVFTNGTHLCNQPPENA